MRMMQMMQMNDGVGVFLPVDAASTDFFPARVTR